MIVMPDKEKGAHPRLGEFASTAIAGNDILSSSLYVSGIAILFAGVYAPLIFILIGVVLWLYKHVYTEVVEALPLNGGTYNCLLNATSKTFASVAGVMTILSYVVTSVISAKTASSYIGTIFHNFPVLIATGAIIIFFAGLVIAGVKESSKVAMAIFSFHLLTLLLFIGLGLLRILNSGWGMLPENFEQTIQLFKGAFTSQGGISFGVGPGAIKMLVLAFAASLLGVSGFESSADFVEEQKKGVFRKTLRNMLIGVIVLNPLIALVVLHTMGLSDIAAAKDFILADVAQNLGGNAFKYIMVIDAFLVLSGAVLTSFVGVSGLMYRMTLDHCLPSSILLPRMKNRNTHISRIVVAFSLLCLSILIITQGDLLSLAGVYTISFLGVMTLFAVGNMILRVNRPDLKRTYQGPIIYVILAGLATLIGVIGNIFIDHKNIVFFSFYFFPAAGMVLAMVYRDYILEWLLHLTKGTPFLHKRMLSMFAHVTRPKIIIFSNSPEKLYKSLQYVYKNETSRNVLVIHCSSCDDPKESQAILVRFQEYITLFKQAGVLPLLNVELIADEELPFGPETVRHYAHHFHLSLNNVFVGSIHETHSFSFEDLGGVRIIQ